MTKKKFYIVSGGTFCAVAPHFSLCAPAFGRVGRTLAPLLERELASVGAAEESEVRLILTRMAIGGGERSAEELAMFAEAGIADLLTNDDLTALVKHLTTRDDTRCIVMTAAVFDFAPHAVVEAASHDAEFAFGKRAHRLDSSKRYLLVLDPAEKAIANVRRYRKDVFLVAFKTTSGEDERMTYAKGLRLLKRSSANLVFANDVARKTNMVVTPEEYTYEGRDREETIRLLARMTAMRTRLDFVRTRVVQGERADPVALSEEGAIPANFVPVLRHLIERGAYKPFLGRTSGHFGCKVVGKPYARISSVRKENHNLVFGKGMAKIHGCKDGVIVAEGGKPSVGEHTQHRIYEALGDKVDSIVHFHCERQVGFLQLGLVPGVPQFGFECGSVQCGENTASHMEELEPGIWAVMLIGHGPNIAFSKDVPAAQVIAFIERKFELEQKTGGELPESF